MTLGGSETSKRSFRPGIVVAAHTTSFNYLGLTFAISTQQNKFEKMHICKKKAVVRSIIKLNYLKAEQRIGYSPWIAFGNIKNKQDQSQCRLINRGFLQANRN